MGEIAIHLSNAWLERMKKQILELRQQKKTRLDQTEKNTLLRWTISVVWKMGIRKLTHSKSENHTKLSEQPSSFSSLAKFWWVFPLKAEDFPFSKPSNMSPSSRQGPSIQRVAVESRENAASGPQFLRFCLPEKSLPGHRQIFKESSLFHEDDSTD